LSLSSTFFGNGLLVESAESTKLAHWGKKQMQQKIGQNEFSYMDSMLQLHSIARCLKGDDFSLLIVDSLST
jgi:hypothetical protein